MKFSIIMPVYNAVRYLRPAIESILNQEFTDFELLLIDDGSSDGSAAICDTFADADNRIRAFHHTNGGICKSRNFGIKEANGEYITFCDHDDLYSPWFLKTIATNLSRDPGHADIVKVNYDIYARDEQGNTAIVQGGANGPDQTWSERSSYEFLVRISSMAWDGAYRREFLLSENIKFDETFTCGGEDADFSLRCIAASSETRWLSTVCYRHFTNYGTSTSSRFHSVLINDYLRVAATEHMLFPNLIDANIVLYFRRWLAGLHTYIFSAKDNPVGLSQMANCYALYMKQLLGTNKHQSDHPLSISERILMFIAQHHLSLVYGYCKALLLILKKNSILPQCYCLRNQQHVCHSKQKPLFNDDP